MEQTRKIALWGAGIRCRQWLSSGFGKIAQFVFDNSNEKHNTFIEGILVINPESVENWKEFFVVIVSDHIEEISNQLKMKGLTEYIDYISYKEYYANVPTQEATIEALKELFAVPSEMVCRVESKTEYDKIHIRYPHITEFENALNSFYKKVPGKRGGYYGYCSHCREKRMFTVDYLWTDGSEPAWRETLFCEKCGFNSRMRFILERLKEDTGKKDIYIYEQVTTLYRELKKNFPNLVGSEYLGEKLQGGTVLDGIMHQDALNLSFADCSFDVMISCDVLEHVADYKRALRETYRCLKHGGKFYLTIPVFKHNDKSRVRVKQDVTGELRYLQPPVYHGNPLSSEGSLVFTDFGWDILQELRDIGFKQSYGVVYFSSKKGYLGDFPVIFEAIK